MCKRTLHLQSRASLHHVARQSYRHTEKQIIKYGKEYSHLLNHNVVLKEIIKICVGFDSSSFVVSVYIFTGANRHHTSKLGFANDHTTKLDPHILHTYFIWISSQQRLPECDLFPRILVSPCNDMRNEDGLRI